MGLLSRLKQFATEDEATSGTAEVLIAADVQVEVEELDVKYTNEFNERNPLRASLSPVASIPGATMGEITGKIEVVGGGAAATKPPVRDILIACGMREFVTKSIVLAGAPTGTFIPGEQFTSGAKEGRVIKIEGTTLFYALISGADFAATDAITGTRSGATATIHATTPNITALNWAYLPISIPEAVSLTAGVKIGTEASATTCLFHQIFGARGNGSIEVDKAGGLAYLNFTLQGAATKPIDSTLFTGVVLPTVTPEAFLSAGLTIMETGSGNGESVCVDGMRFDFGQTVARRACANAATGTKSYRHSGPRRPVISIAPESELEADVAFWTRYDAGTRFGFFAQIGATSMKRCAICAAAAMFQGLAHSDREGIGTYDAELLCTGDRPGGDDEFMIAFF